MNNIKKKIAATVVTLLVCLSVGSVQAGDPRGSKDHPLVERFPGSKIDKYLQQNRTRLVYATGPIANKKITVASVEGKMTSFVYTIPKQHAMIEVFPRFLKGLEGAGFEGIFDCEQEKCGKQFAKTLMLQHNQRSFPIVDVYNMSTDPSDDERNRYWVGKAQSAGKNPVFVSILADYDPHRDWKIQLQIMEQDNSDLQPIQVKIAALNSNTTNSEWSKSRHSESDTRGSQDHPLVGRFPGAWIRSYLQNDFSDYVLASGKADKKGFPQQKVEGKVTALIYRAPKNITHYEIHKNYQSALIAQGFQEIYSCSQQHCGHYLGRKLFTEANGRKFPNVDVGNMKPDPTNSSKFNYWAGVLPRAEGDVYVSLMTDYTPGISSEYQLHIVESGSMKMDQVTVTLDSMKNSIQQQGKVVLSGLYFDHDKATLKPQSDQALKVIRDYLQKNPQQSGYVVGHTDIKGSLKYNRDLSEKRARAVVEALIKRGVKREQIESMGVGPLSPSLSNTRESGRAKNRRVELVIKEI